jgi:hypothetical protein
MLRIFTVAASIETKIIYNLNVQNDDQGKGGCVLEASIRQARIKLDLVSKGSTFTL